MIALLCFVLNVLVSPFKSTSRLEAENAALRHQVVMLRRIVHRRVRLTNSDRMFFIQLYRWFPSVLKVIAVSNITTWCRSAAFSASSWLVDLNGETKTLRTKHSSAIIVRRR